MRTHYGEKYWDKLCGKPMPEESTPPIWKENYLLQQQYIEELERELNAANDRIMLLEEAGISAIHEAIYGREDDALEIWRKAMEAKP